jgi:hypothetical protein
MWGLTRLFGAVQEKKKDRDEARKKRREENSP